MTARTLILVSPAETCAFARRLAPGLGPGDTLLLSGGVGAGKTHFARCLIQALLPVPEDVPSPTFTLVQTYAAPAAEIWHADLYRLTDPLDLVELGLTEAFETAITLVEWPERLGDLVPANALSIDLAPGDADEARRLTLRWSDPRWTPRLEGIADA